MADPIVNRVAESGLITLDLEKFLPDSDILVFDLKPYLFRELILKEKDFRESLKNIDWEQYRDRYVAIICSADAIIPFWAYMLVSSYLQPLAKDLFVGGLEEARSHFLLKNISAINTEELRDKRIVIKGCGEESVSAAAYAEITRLLAPFAKSIMYGEPCSTVPVYKRR